MPVFHFTLHAYRSWHEDDPRGYVQRGEEGIQPSNPNLAAYRDRLASQSEVRFSADQMILLLDAVRTTCERRNWIAHGATATCTHVHAVIRWTQEQTAEQVQAGLKSGLGFCLSKEKGTTGNRWFSRGGAPARVEDHAHLFHLLNDYLPKHATDEGGLFRNYEDERKDAAL